jgi:hypothetical protein
LIVRLPPPGSTTVKVTGISVGLSSAKAMKQKVRVLGVSLSVNFCWPGLRGKSLLGIWFTGLMPFTLVATFPEVSTT